MYLELVLILELAKALEITPTPPNRSDPVISIMYLELVFNLPITFHQALSILNVFQDFRFPLHPPSFPGSDLKWKWIIWDIRSFYMSGLNKINIPQFSRFFLLPPPRWSNRGNDCYQVDLCRSLTFQPIFIILACPEAPNSPKQWRPPPRTPPKGSNPIPLCQSRISDLCLFFPSWYIPISTLKAFSNIFVPPLMSLDPVGI